MRKLACRRKVHVKSPTRLRPSSYILASLCLAIEPITYTRYLYYYLSNTTIILK